MTKLRPGGALIVMFLVACSEAPHDQPTGTALALATKIYWGGDIITVSDSQPSAEAVAIGEGLILAVGSEADVMRHKGAETEMIDLSGQTLLPGFIDAHGHVFNTGLQALAAVLLPQPDGAVDSIAIMQETLRDWAAAHPDRVAATGWIIGFGYDDAQLAEQRHPTREELDQVSATVPVLAVHQSSHLGAVNSKALEVAGVSAATQDPPGGLYRRHEGSTEPNGVLEEMAFFNLVFGVLGKLDAQQNDAMLKAGLDLYASFGFTTAQEGRATSEATATIASVAERGELIMDVVAYPDFQAAVDTLKPPLLSVDYSRRFRIGGVKLSLDGSPQGKTAWLTAPYRVPPAGQPEGYRGYPSIENDDEVNALIDQAFANDWQVLVHCNGDAAADQFIEAVRLATDKFGRADRRPVMIHAQTVREDQLDAMTELGIIPSFFGMHTYYWGDWHRDSVLGPERAARISPARSALIRDMRFTQHHDAPVALPSSTMILATQVNRTTRTGQVLGAGQRVSVMDALKSITINAAYQYFEDDRKGSIEVGKLADFAILDRNPLEIDPADLQNVKVVETIKEGETIYRAGSAM